MSKVYLHGYSNAEQDRLSRQAEMLQKYVFEHVDFKKCRNVIEIGSGVGAQTEILLRKFPKTHYTCIDFSEEQLVNARQKFQSEIKKNKISFHQMSSENIKSLNKKFDGAFMSWFLEHLKDPVKTLKALHGSLKKDAPVFITEVQNACFFINPYSPNILQFWHEFNDFQWYTSGNPFVGANLGNLLQQVGFRDIKIYPKIIHVDRLNRHAQSDLVEDFRDLILTSSKLLIEKKKVKKQLVDNCLRELDKIKKDKNFVYEFGFVSASAIK